MDRTPFDDAPGDVPVPEDVPTEVFQDWCKVASDCIVDGTNPPASEVGCVQGSCRCGGDYLDPGLAVGEEFAGWSCVRREQPSLPLIPMKYTIEWSSPDITCPLSEDQMATVLPSLKNALVDFFQLVDFELSDPYCGSIHFAGTGKSTLPGKSGFADFYASNSNNPFGAPTVTGQKAALQVDCLPVHPQLTTVLVNGLCQPLTCADGYTLVSSGQINVQSTCVVNPPPGVVATAAPPTVPIGRVVISSDDDLPVGTAMGIAFGVAAFIGIIIIALVFFFKSSAATSTSDYENEQLQQQQVNNGPDKDDDYNSLPQ